MKEKKLFRAFAGNNVTLWETLHDLEIPVSASINPVSLHFNSGLTPESIFIIIGKAPPATVLEVQKQADLPLPGNISALDLL